MLVNPSFEAFDGTNQPHGWTVTGTASLCTQDVQMDGLGRCVDGIKTCKLTGTGTVGVQQAITLVPATNYTLSWWGYTGAGAGPYTIPYSIICVGGASDGLFLQAGGTWAASDALTVSLPSSTLTSFSKTFQIPSDANGVKVWLKITGAVGIGYWIDQAAVVIASEAMASDYQAFNTQISPRALDMIGWSRDLPTDPLFYSGESTIPATLGAAPFLLLSPVSTLTSYTGGANDAALASFAASCVSYGGAIYADFAEEMNGSGTAWGNGHETAAQYIAGWQYVVNKFRAAGATNVKWIWSPVSFIAGATSGNLDPTIVGGYPCYPGDSYVDYIGWHGEVNSLDISGAGASLSSLYGSDYTALTGLSASKPLMISQLAVGKTGNGGTIDKASWFSSMNLSSYPRVQGFVYWNKPNTISDSSDASQDYTIDNQGDSPTIAAAFSAVVNASPFVGGLFTIIGKTGTSASAVMQKAASGWTYITGKTGTSGTAVDQKGAGSFTKVSGH